MMKNMQGIFFFTRRVSSQSLSRNSGCVKNPSSETNASSTFLLAYDFIIACTGDILLVPSGETCSLLTRSG